MNAKKVTGHHQGHRGQQGQGQGERLDLRESSRRRLTKDQARRFKEFLHLTRERLLKETEMADEKEKEEREVKMTDRSSLSQAKEKMRAYKEDHAGAKARAREASARRPPALDDLIPSSAPFLDRSPSGQFNEESLLPYHLGSSCLIEFTNRSKGMSVRVVAGDLQKALTLMDSAFIALRQRNIPIYGLNPGEGEGLGVVTNEEVPLSPSVLSEGEIKINKEREALGQELLKVEETIKHYNTLAKEAEGLLAVNGVSLAVSEGH